MLAKIFGKKIGMTQIFDDQRVVHPVTVIRVNGLFVTQVKTSEKDGYSAIQVGMVRDRYRGLPFDNEWLKSKKTYFLHVKEVPLKDGAAAPELGTALTLKDLAVQVNEDVHVTGNSKGAGFQGVVKRWNFAGGPKTHGSRFHRKPGSVGTSRTQSEVCKGKKLPGHMGDRQITVKNLRVLRIDEENECFFIRGAVPGKKDSLIIINATRGE